MAAYMLVDVDVRDAEKYAKYRDEVPALIAKHGGEYLVRGGDFDVVEGDWQPHRLVLFRFPNRKAIHDLMGDPEYEELKALRQSVANSIVVAMDGIE
tara:strand:- start:16520 stop:16810 length:291 start_codon:yes stop_codon:yes gene_type:complete